MKYNLEKCYLCPRNCGANRKDGKVGLCGATDKIKIAHASLHYFEEPCISGKNGSGTVFFSNCNLNCVFCQNYKISQEGYGEEISVDKLVEVFIKLQDMHANNINLVTPSIYVPQIKEAILNAKENGLRVPVIYNSSGYENVETIKMLKGCIDVYLPDFKYYDNNIAFEYSKVKNYFENVTSSILEMYNQVGKPKFDSQGLIKSGVIIRHMILPAHTKDSKKVLLWIKENLGDDVYVSIMAQYFPTNKANEYPLINRKISKLELEVIKKYLSEIGLFNGYIQKIGKHEEEYVPDFNLNLIK